nr:hypothetical protein Iba_scaffold1522222CG0010 [Ipomoea batatas]
MKVNAHVEFSGSAPLLNLYMSTLVSTVLHQSLMPSSTSRSSSSSKSFSRRACCSSLLFFCHILKRTKANPTRANIPRHKPRTTTLVELLDE